MSYDKTRIKKVDLHGFHVKKAKDIVRKNLEQFNYKRYDQVQFIVGKGKHSKNGKPVLKPAIRTWLVNNGYSFEIPEKNTGCIYVNMIEQQNTDSDSHVKYINETCVDENDDDGDDKGDGDDDDNNDDDNDDDNDVDDDDDDNDDNDNASKSPLENYYEINQQQPYANQSWHQKRLPAKSSLVTGRKNVKLQVSSMQQVKQPIEECVIDLNPLKEDLIQQQQNCCSCCSCKKCCRRIFFCIMIFILVIFFYAKLYHEHNL